MRKSTLFAAVIFVALLVGTYASLRRKPERGITRISFAAIDKDKIDALQIGGKNPAELRRQDGKWLLADGREADEGQVKPALEALGRVASSDVLSSNPDRFGEYEVDDAKGVRVEAFAGPRKVASLVLGKAVEGGSAVRVGDAVYGVRGVWSSAFSKPANAWRQLKLFADSADDATRVEIALAGRPPYALVKKDGKWQLDDPKAAPAGFRFDPQAAAGLAAALVGARAKEILDKDPGAETTRLDGKGDVFAFLGKDGARRELQLGGEAAEKAAYARVIGKGEVYLLADWAVRNIRKQIADLRDLALTSVEKDKIRKLEISDGKGELVLEKQGADWRIAKSAEAIPADFKLAPEMVERRLASFASARALRAAEAGAATGLAKPRARLTATLEDGKRVTLAFGAETKDEGRDAFFARGNADDGTYVVGKWVRDDLLGGLSSFKERPAAAAPDIDPSALQNLPPDVRNQILQQLIQRRQQEAALKASQAQPKK